MSWAKLDDQFADHPKIANAGPLASWLYVCGLIYCARYETDGFIPKGQLRKLADLDSPQKLAERLVSCGLWEIDPNRDGFVVHDYLDYNPSTKQATEKKQTVSQERSKAGAKGAEKRWHDNNNSDGNGIANGWQNDSKTNNKGDGNFMAPSPSPSPSQSEAEEEKTAPNGAGTEAARPVGKDAVAVFCEHFKGKFGENPDMPPRYAKGLKDLLLRVKMQTYERAVAGFLSDPWPSESGYSVSIFLSQPVDRWTRQARAAPKGVMPVPVTDPYSHLRGKANAEQIPTA